MPIEAGCYDLLILCDGPHGLPLRFPCMPPQQTRARSIRVLRKSGVVFKRDGRVYCCKACETGKPGCYCAGPMDSRDRYWVD